MTLNRRAFLGASAALVALGRSALAGELVAEADDVQTVLGPAMPSTLGPTLIHEHVLVDFIGADRLVPGRYERAHVVAVMQPFLEAARANGLHTLVDCTPAYLGRDPRLLQALSRVTGVQILTNTGYYGAANDKYLPRHAFTETAEQLAARWVAEARAGIEDTGIRPALMKIGVDAGPLSAVDAKLVRAAGLAHAETGLVIGSHTGDGVAALAQLDLLTGMGVAASAFIWMHAQNEPDRAIHRRVAARGAWVEFDGVGPTSITQHVNLVLGMHEANLIARTLVSQDAGWYHVGERNGGTVRPYTTMFETFLPALRKAGLTAAEKRQLIVDNPKAALTGMPLLSGKPEPASRQ